MNSNPFREELYVSGFGSDFRLRDRDDTVSIAKSTSTFSTSHSVFLGKAGDVSKARQGSPDSIPSSSSPRRRTEDGPIQVDFYRNPTVLSRMILYNKFSSANKRCRDHPEEVSVWVCAKRKTSATQKAPIHSMFDRSQSVTTITRQQQRQQGVSTSDKTEYSLRQLPIHIACTSLAFAHDSVLRSELEQLIIRLIVTYPEGCGEFDHGGRIPLHEALWSGSSASVVSMLLMAAPVSIDLRDKFGRSAMELNNRCPKGAKDEIRDMLLLGAAYWERARDEARLRMKLAVVPPPGGSVTSTNILGTSQADKESIFTTESANLPDQKHRIQIESEEITPIAWEQLERRVLLLEQLLEEMYEQNYELAGAVEQLKKAKKVLTLKLEAARAQQSSHVSPRGLNRHVRGRGSLGSGSIETITIPEDATIPDEDETTIASLVDHVESLVGSYHGKRKRSPRGGDSGVSELSSFSSHTNGSSIPLQPASLTRCDSLVSGLSMSEASFFDSSSYAVRGGGNSPDGDSPPTLGRADSMREAPEALGTDNLNEMFHKVASMYGSNHNPASHRRGWATPISASTFAPTDAPAFPPTSMVVEEDSSEDGSAFAEDEKVSANRNAGEIYIPGFMMEPDTTYANSTLSISGSSAVSPAPGTRMSEESTLEPSLTAMSHDGRVSTTSGGDDDHDETEDDDATRETMSTRARFIEDMVFGGTDDEEDTINTSPADPARYNFDIRIPALDTFFGPDSAEI
jgi:hypothetical protein